MDGNVHPQASSAAANNADLVETRPMHNVGHSRFRLNDPRVAIVVVWLSFFFLDVTIAFNGYLRGYMLFAAFSDLLNAINSSYATYIGVMLTFIFTTNQKREGSENLLKLDLPFYLAVAASIFWNVAVSVFIVQLLLQVGTAQTAVAAIHLVSPLLSWLVAPAIGYYFAKNVETK